MAVFVRSVESGGFAAAAKAFGLSATMVGLHVRALEDRLGSRLLNRTTRKQSLTEVGRLYYERCKRILAEIEIAEASGIELHAAPRGRLHIAAPVSFGVHALAPAIADYLALYPDVEIELTLNDRSVDLIEEGFEIAFRIGTLPDSSLITRALAPYRMVLCAAPAYLQRHGEPILPSDLVRHNCLGFAHWRVGREWHFEGPDGPSSAAVRGTFRTNNGEALRMAARKGLGIVLQPEVLLIDDIKAGLLVPILTEHILPSRPMHILYLPDRRPTPKLRTFIDFAAERFGARQAGATQMS